MPSGPATRHKRASLVQRAARIAFAFIVMNVAAVAGLIAAVLRKQVWSR